MTLRQKLACVGLTVFGLQIASAAAGGAPLADRLRLWLDPEQLLLASVRMELGAPPVDASPTPEAAAVLSAATPAPAATKWGKLKSGAGWISLDYVTKL